MFSPSSSTFPATSATSVFLSEPARAGDRHTMSARSPSVGIPSKAIGLPGIMFATLGVSPAGHLGPNPDHPSNVTNTVQFGHSVLSDSLWPHESQHTRSPCPSPTPRVYSDLCPSSWWCHPAISSSVVPFSSCSQPFPASGSFPMSQRFAWDGQNIGVSASASVLPMNTQDWSPSGWTGWISLQSNRLLRVFSNTTVQNHQFFGPQLSSQSN